MIKNNYITKISAAMTMLQNTFSKFRTIDYTITPPQKTL